MVEFWVYVGYLAFIFCIYKGSSFIRHGPEPRNHYWNPRHRFVPWTSGGFLSRTKRFTSWPLTHPLVCLSLSFFLPFIFIFITRWSWRELSAKRPISSTPEWKGALMSFRTQFLNALPYNFCFNDVAAQRGKKSNFSQTKTQKSICLTPSMTWPFLIVNELTSYHLFVLSCLLALTILSCGLWLTPMST